MYGNKGAAIATLISQLFNLVFIVIGFILCIRKDGDKPILSLHFKKSQSGIIGDSFMVSRLKPLIYVGFEAPGNSSLTPFDSRLVFCMLSVVFFIIFLYSFSGTAGTFSSSYFAANFLNSSASIILFQMCIIVRHIYACMSYNLTTVNGDILDSFSLVTNVCRNLWGIYLIKTRFPIFFFS